MGDIFSDITYISLASYSFEVCIRASTTEPTLYLKINSFAENTVDRLHAARHYLSNSADPNTARQHSKG